MDIAISLTDISSYLPDNRVSAEYFAHYAADEEQTSNVMFKAPPFRHHIAPGETPADMAERAIAPMRERRGDGFLKDVDILIVHTQLSESAVVGDGGEIAHRLGIAPEWLIDLHNGGCAAMIYGIKIAKQILSSSEAKKALVITVTNTAGQIFTQEHVRSLAQAAIPGDGAGAALLEKNDHSPIVATYSQHLPQYAGQMTAIADPPRKYWEAGDGQLHIGFTESKIVKVLHRGNKLVPEAGYNVLQQIGATPEDVDLFITNQPNRAFLRNWRDALQIPADKHPDTFDEAGNLFGSAIAVTFDGAVTHHQVNAGDLVLFGAFAHAGDFAAAAAVRWGGRPA